MGFLRPERPSQRLSCRLRRFRPLRRPGSETSSSSVITKEEGALKRGFNHALIRPRFTLMNPELLYTLPAYQTGLRRHRYHDAYL